MPRPRFTYMKREWGKRPLQAKLQRSRRGAVEYAVEGMLSPPQLTPRWDITFG
jgi:hypothetical protein